MKKEKPILLDLFIAFAKVGVMTFGGGYAMIPILERELVTNRDWVTNEELMDYYAIGQCTPGIIAVNTATFVGYKKAGVLGGIVATMGILFPSFVIISIIATVLSNFADIPAVKSAFAGIRVCVCVLILNAVIKLCKSALKDNITTVIFVAVLTLSALFQINPIIFVVICGLIGILMLKMGVKK